MAATDPVSVLTTLKEIGARGRLALVIEAESLLNDGTAAVLFAIAIGFVSGESLTYQAVAITFWTTIVIGFLAGAIVAGVVFVLIGRTDDHLLEVALTIVAAYGSFLLAEHFAGSGILATLTAGMLLGNLGTRWGFFSEAGDRAVRSTWEFITFLANSLVFLLIGLAEGHEDFKGLWWTAGGAVIAVLAGRAAAVYPVCALFSRGPNRVDLTQQHALVWGGLRGALALALVLSIPESFPWRHPIVVVTFAVVAFSIIVQGLTCRPLLRRACQDRRAVKGWRTWCGAVDGPLAMRLLLSNSRRSSTPRRNRQAGAIRTNRFPFTPRSGGGAYFRCLKPVVCQPPLADGGRRWSRQDTRFRVETAAPDCV